MGWLSKLRNRRHCASQPSRRTGRRSRGTARDRSQQESLDRFGHYTFVVQRDAASWTGNLEIALLTRAGEIVEIGRLASATGAPTGMRKLRYKRGFEIDPLPVAEIERALPKHQYRSAFAQRSVRGGTLPKGTWAATVHAIRSARPDSASDLNALFERVSSRGGGLTEHALQIATHERDAVGLALEFAGFDRAILEEAVPDGGASFLERLGDVRALEDPAIAFDSLQFLDFDAIGSPAGVVTLRHGDEELTVINANRQSLETTLGADLIYLDERRGGLVFVQYKTMHEQLEGHPAFRGDQNLDAELDAMRKINAGDDDASAKSFRLGGEYGFVKLCAPVVSLRPRDTGPISGLYLPLGYLDAILASDDEGRGPRGGIAINQWTVDRYLTNTQFAELVRGGWVGTRGAATLRLQDLIISLLRARRSETLAVKRSGPATRRGPQPRRRPSRASGA